MGIEKTRLLECDSIYWFSMDSDIEGTAKTAPHALISSQHDLKTNNVTQNY